MQALLAARREPPGDQNSTPKAPYGFEHKA